MGNPVNRSELYRRYSLSCFDKDLVLKIPFTMWLIIGYATYPFLFSIAGYIPRGGKNMEFLGEFIGIISLLGSFCALLFLIAYFKRSPDASGFWRGCWHRGALLLFIPPLSFVADAAIASSRGSLTGLLQEKPVIYLSILCLLCGYQLFFSRRIADTLADYPLEKSD